MYKSNVNIKHANKSHLYWGIDKSTGDVAYINDVVLRGLNCNCKCAACQGDFIAKKGEKNAHHFAHQSNYDCVYANEIAVYLLVEKILANCGNIEVPCVKVRMGQLMFSAKKEGKINVGPVYFHCEPGQYPPLLIAELGGVLTRIVLSFESYYKADDYALLENEARENGWDCLSFKLPRIINEKSINARLIENSVKVGTISKEWIFSELKDGLERQAFEKAKTPQIIKGRTKNAYACPIHEREYNGLFYAFPSDCEQCYYNCAPDSECRCLAIDGYLNLKDLNASVEKRMERLANLQKEKDQIREIKKQNLQKHRADQGGFGYQRPGEETIPKRSLPASEKYRIGFEEIRSKMIAPLDTPVRDQFGVRWAKCKICQAIKPTSEMSIYGGPNEANLGKCRKCVIEQSMRK